MKEIMEKILDGYILWLIIFFLVSFFLKSKRFFKLFLVVFFIYLIGALVIWLDLQVTAKIFEKILLYLPIVVLILIGPDIRRTFETSWSRELLEAASIGSMETKTHIVEAAMYLSSNKIGALITIEKHNSLDLYADRAIVLNSVVSKELLINIFTPNTPLHDGAVIIKGDVIRAAGAYFDLSERDKEDKTMGSRHRAALGISESTDSLTIVVSEETGNISLAIEGIIIRANEREKIYEYINMYMK